MMCFSFRVDLVWVEIINLVYTLKCVEHVLVGNKRAIEMPRADSMGDERERHMEQSCQVFVH